jgi:hypothetical protein
MNKEIRQLSKDEAITLAESKWWEKSNHQSIAAFQIMQDKLCCPFDVFHEAIEKTLGRPVFTHEFGMNWKRLADEVQGKVSAPTLTEIMDLIPADKRFVVKID